jgi:putative addiction module killer protein
MDIGERDVKMLVLSGGQCPFEEWFRTLRDVQAAASVDARLTRVRAGNMGDCRSVGDGVSELRIPSGPGYRIYFGQSGHTVAILLCGRDKSTQDYDIERARDWWRRYSSDAKGFRRYVPR